MRIATTRVLATATASILTVGLTATALSSAAVAQTGAGASERQTKVALKASGFGSRIRAGDLPAGSDTTAYIAIGCATRTGVERENHEAQAELPGAGTIAAVKTRVWTTQSGGGVHSYSRNTTANVVLAESPLGSLKISALSSLSHAWHDAKGFHAETATSVGKLTFVPPMGEPQELELPTPGEPVEVPGLATISLGGSSKTVNEDGATAVANSLRVELIPSNTVVVLGHTTAQALAGVKNGVFRGSSAATEISAGDGAITSGRNPLSLMPCQGTDGELLTKEIADVDLGGQLVVAGLTSAQRGTQFKNRSVAMERGSIAGLNLGGGQLVIDAVVGQVKVTRTAAGKLTSNIKGSRIGAITANGEPQEFPDTGPIEIPGLAKLEPMVVERSKTGISVVALRITLLDGTGAVIDLGVAKAGIRR